jgi:hypothetical protein
MLHFPSFRRIQNAHETDIFANTYTQCSGFNVPRSYYESNQVFGIYWKGCMIGGFVLGSGTTLRTLEVFAGDGHRAALYQHVQKSEAHTEMCCFWIDPVCRKKTGLNFFVWLCVAYALRTYGTSRLIFGTNSIRLAALYGAASKSELLHRDVLNQKQTFIFSGPRKYCLLGVAQILWYKAKRAIKIAGTRRASGKPAPNTSSTTSVITA